MPFPTILLNDGRKIPQIGFGSWKIPKDVCTGQVDQAIESGSTISTRPRVRLSPISVLIQIIHIPSADSVPQCTGTKKKSGSRSKNPVSPAKKSGSPPNGPAWTEKVVVNHARRV